MSFPKFQHYLANEYVSRKTGAPPFDPTQAISAFTPSEEYEDPEEMWATDPTNGCRVIFEAKTLAGSTEVKQTRYALSQLLEYRYFDGTSEDRLCLVTDAPVSYAREQFLRTQGIGVLVIEGEGFRPMGPLAHQWFGALVRSSGAATPSGMDGVES
ncbi:hypothetical protein [Stigmatella erecta]|uniref:Restriction endonuclease n=1 Tax=Stigmatella erecta TaxID=83460 RepID=A0A1I0A1F1_9BACT|nr:hypothetical protein [Stigmatella erecta]SES87936.1 hypothetical protein SAMN05443639_101513 [Stigmatella erecta]